MSPKVCLFLFTDGRNDCLKQTAASWTANLVGSFYRGMLIDDLGGSRQRLEMDCCGIKLEYVRHDKRLGFGGTIRDAWSRLPDDCDYVFHLEDDFVLKQYLVLDDLVAAMEANPHFAQICLLRQPWNERERKAGGVWQQFPDDFIECGNGKCCWLEHRRWFSTNPCLYPRWVVEMGWPENAHSEGMFSHKLFKNPVVKCAYWGSKQDSPIVEHVGWQRKGIGY